MLYVGSINLKHFKKFKHLYHFHDENTDSSLEKEMLPGNRREFTEKSQYITNLCTVYLVFPWNITIV